MEISLIPDWGNVLGKFTQSAEAPWMTEKGWGRRRRRKKWKKWWGWGYKVYFRLSSVFFDLKASWKTERAARQRNTWRTVSDGTIWCESGFDSSHKTDWSHPSSAGLSWQRHSAANQSSYESSWVWALLIIIFPLGHKPICLVFNTTKFSLSCWQNGSGHCLKSCDENNFFRP